VASNRDAPNERLHAQDLLSGKHATHLGVLLGGGAVDDGVQLRLVGGAAELAPDT